MTEGQGREIEFFARQNVLGGKRAPALWAMSMHIDHLKFLYELGGMDVVEWGEATKGIPVTESQEQVETLPWATRYLQCANGAESICNDAPRFCCTCWVDREDGIFPPTPQKENSSNNGDFHPGWRTHQLRGRNLAFGMLWLLQEAVDIWKTSVSGERIFHLVILRLMYIILWICSNQLVGDTKQADHPWMIRFGM